MPTSYRYVYLSRKPYSGAQPPPFKRHDGTGEVDWDDTSNVTRYALTEIAPGLGWEQREVTQLPDWFPPAYPFMYKYAVALWQWVSPPVVIPGEGSALVQFNYSPLRLRAMLSPVTQNYLQAHVYYRIVTPDGSTRQPGWLQHSEIAPNYSTASLRALSGARWEDPGYATIYHGDRIAFEVGVVNANPYYLAGRTIALEIGEGSGTFLAENDTEQHDAFVRLFRWTNADFEPEELAGTTNAGRHSRPRKPSHAPCIIAYPPTPRPAAAPAPFNGAALNRRRLNENG